MAYAATLKNGNHFNVLFRFIITPLFMFSGVFFPIDRLAVPVQWIAQASPLYHGVQLVRGLALGRLNPLAATLHLRSPCPPDRRCRRRTLYLPQEAVPH